MAWGLPHVEVPSWVASMFEPVSWVGGYFYSLLPSQLQFRRPKLNFIMVHYLYMIGLSIACSIILYGAAFIPYIDALFFAAGSSTQSGLNTIDVNKLHLYQQVTMMLIACISCPIFINTVVVFVRLYWFEKRFEHIVKEIRQAKRTKAKTVSRTKSESALEADANRLERGVNGREIRVLHETTVPNALSGAVPPAAAEYTESNLREKELAEKMGLTSAAKSVVPTPESSNKSSNSSGGDTVADDGTNHETEGIEGSGARDEAQHPGLNTPLHRDIVFADELPIVDRDHHPSDDRLPQQQPNISKHIEFLERQQRNAKEGTAIRIPGPRDFDRGKVPQQLDNSTDDELGRPQTRNTLAPVRSEQEQSEQTNDEHIEPLNNEDVHERGALRFDEPEHPGHRDRRNSNNMERVATHGSRFSSHTFSTGGPLRHRASRSGLPNIAETKGSAGHTFSTLNTARSKERLEDPLPYLSYQATIGRNSIFVALTEEQREELGGIEYRALKALAKILIFYFVGFHLLGMVTLLPWIVRTNRWGDVVRGDGVTAVWWGFFTPASMFNDLGLTLTPDSMNSFEQATLPLLLGSFLIIIGNTGFPCMLRFMIWIFSKIVPYGSSQWEELRFLLDHPRRCFTLLFPSKATWWLFWILVLMNGIDLIFFIILDLDDPTVTHLPPGYRVLDGWFQASSTRTAGFSCVNLANLHPAIQVSYMIMMYISVFPIAISVRRTNVYEEKSLGIWAGEEVSEEDEDPSYVGQHLRRQLSFDLWYIFLGFFIICIAEGSRLQNNKLFAFTLFNVLFEIVSAYGTVGLSLGYPGTDTSFSAQFGVISKLVIIAMMIRGRHRGLPYALDRAVLLPSEGLQKKEAEDAERRYARRGSAISDADLADLTRNVDTWRSRDDVDDKGVSKRHSAPFAGTADAALTAGDRTPSPEAFRKMQRRPSGVSHHQSESRGKHERSRSISRIIASGLSAGPTFSKHD